MNAGKDQEDQAFWDVIEGSLDLKVVGKGDGWIVFKISDELYEVATGPEMATQLEASIFLKKKLKITPQKFITTDGHCTESGLISVCYIKKDKK